jgi:hypothetical protein
VGSVPVLSVNATNPLNSPRWPDAPAGGFHEVWSLTASDAKTGRGLWLRWSVTVDEGGRTGAVSASWFDRDQPQRTFALASRVDGAAISRTGVAFGGSRLTAEGCEGELEGKGHALRWRLSFGQGFPAEDLVPGWLSPVAKLRGSGFVLPQPATTVSGAVEIDGAIVELQRAPAAQAHFWSRDQWPRMSARCAAFTEDPAASIELLDLEGPRGLHVPSFVLRFRGEVHRFSDLPWIAYARSRGAPPAWHFAARDARLSIDGVVRALPHGTVEFAGAAGQQCASTAIASMEVRVSARPLPGAGWRPEATLTSKAGGTLEFCGQSLDLRVKKPLAAKVPGQKEGRAPGSVAF